MDNRLLKSLQDEIYKKAKKACDNLFASQKAINLYRKNYFRMLPKKWRKTSYQKLIQNLIKANIVYIGDFHTLDQNAKNLVVLLSELIKKKIKPTLAIEMIKAKDFPIIDAFIQRSITEKEFLGLLDYKQSWPFPWSIYRPILLFCRDYNLKVVPINTEGPLTQRDIKASQFICREFEEFPENPIIVFYGEFHLAKNKIPKLVTKKLSYKKALSITIHQNIHNFSSKKMISFSPEVLMSDKQNYCINNCPGWLKYESMIQWFEAFDEDSSINLHSYILKQSLNLQVDSPSDQVHALCHFVNKKLSLQIEKSFLENFNTYDGNQIDIVNDKLSNHKTSNIYMSLLKKGFYFKIPYELSYYGPYLSLHQIIKVSGVHLAHTYGLKYHIKEDSSFYKDKKAIFFYWLRFHTLSSFFISFINPYLNSPLYKDIISLIKGPKTNAILKKIYQRTISILEEPQNWEKIISTMTYSHLFKLSWVLANILSYNMILARQTNGSFSKLSEFFSPDLADYENLILYVLPNKSFKTQTRNYPL